MGWRWRERAVWLAALGVAGGSLWHARRFFHDDAYITLRYASRMLHGLGPTWTAGVPVEGYTHPAWLLQVAVLGALGVDLEVAARSLGVAYVGAIFVLWWHTGAWAGPLLVLAALPGTALWAVGGLETMGYLFWLLLGAFATLRLAGVVPGEPTPRLAFGAGAALGIAALHRPDGLVFCVLAAAVAARGPHPGLAARLAATAALPVLAWSVFRLAYYGTLQATSATTKISGIRADLQLESFTRYVWSSAEAWAPAAVVLAAALLWRPTPSATALAAASFAAVAPAVLGGGDHMLGARLFLPFVALLALGAGLRWREGRPPLLAAAVACVGLFHASHVLRPPPGRDPAAVWGRIMGEFLEQHLPAGALVATATAGSTPYFSPGIEYIDTLGLNDAHISRRPVRKIVSTWQAMPGHLKGDGEYVLDRRPDVIVRGGAAGNSDIVFLTDHELDRSERFGREYREHVFVVPTRHLTDLGIDVPERVRTSGRARLVTWLRTDSPRVAGLRAVGERIPPVAHEPPTLFEPPSRCVERRVPVARDGVDERSVEFRWRAPPGNTAVYLDLRVPGDPSWRSLRVTGQPHHTLVLAEGTWEWRVSAKVDRWHPSEWRPLLVEACPAERIAVSE